MRESIEIYNIFYGTLFLRIKGKKEKIILKEKAHYYKTKIFISLLRIEKLNYRIIAFFE